MKSICAKNGTSKRGLLVWLLLAFCTFSVVSLSPAFAQQATQNQNPVTNTDDGQDATDTNPGTAWDIRQNYFKRFPYAKDSYNNDVMENVDDGNNTPDGIHPVSRMQRSAPGVPNFVMAYNFVVNYGYYYQWPCPALDTPATMRDNELFDNQLTTFGMPVSDTQFQIIDRENKQRFLELMFDPERIMWTLQNMGVGSSAANSAAGVAESSFDTAVNRVTQADGGGTGGDSGAGIFGAAGGNGGLGALINIANENSGVYTASDNPDKSVPQAVWMVQQMYKFVFVPMAILFLLPGAVLTQVKGQVAYAFQINQDDNSSPFEGFFRAMIAIFLIPATQLIVSYAIDVGNSMSYSVGDYVQTEVIEDWAHQLTYNNSPANVDNAINPPDTSNNGGAANGTAGGANGANGTNGGFLGGAINQAGTGLGVSQSTMSAAMGVIGQLPGISQLFSDLNTFLGQNFGLGGDGLGAQQQEGTAVNEQELWLSQILQLVFNVANYLFSLAVVILTAFQLVLMCYLYLLGPLAAAMFAWPKTGESLFKDIWANWCNAVIIVSLWRFYWMVILAIMTQRILYQLDNGTQINLQWEVAVYTCFMGLMLYVPFSPWNFNPNQAFDMMAAGQAAMQAAGPAMSGALASAGVPQSTINQLGNQFNSVMGQGSQMQNFINANENANNFSQGNYNQNFQSGGQSQPAGGGAPTGGSGTGTGQTQPQQQQQPQPQAAAMSTPVAPAVAPPPVAAPAPATAQPSNPPPTSNGSGNGDNKTAVANAAPAGVNVNDSGSPKVDPSAPKSEQSLTPNPSVSPQEAQKGTESLKQSHDVGASEPPAANKGSGETPAAPTPAPSPTTQVPTAPAPATPPPPPASPPPATPPPPPAPPPAPGAN
jgi:hypothetical protein